MHMTKLRLLLVAFIAVVAIFAATNSSAQTPPTPTPSGQEASQPVAEASYWEKNGCKTFVGQSKYRKTLKRVFRYSIIDGDFRAAPTKKKARAHLVEMRRCAHSAKARKNMVKATRAQRKQYSWVAYIDAITVYGKWAIPYSIVTCESHGSWYAQNPSGATGPYQLLGWGAPYPATTPWAQAQNHIIAARVWAGGRGRSNWVC